MPSGRVAAPKKDNLAKLDPISGLTHRQKSVPPLPSCVTKTHSSVDEIFPNTAERASDIAPSAAPVIKKFLRETR